MEKTSFDPAKVKLPEDAPADVVRILSEITKEQADVFANLCSLGAACFTETPDGKIDSLGNYVILPIYDCLIFAKSLGLDFSAIRELEQLGLIETTMFGYLKQLDPEKHPMLHLVYGDSVFSITEYAPNAFPLGNIILTKSGRYLADYVHVDHLKNYKDILDKFLDNKTLKVSDKPLLCVSGAGGKNFRCEKINREHL